MIPLFRTYLRPYARPLVLVLVLLLIGALGNLYLPELNGEIIDEGVATGDIEFIVRTGALMLLVSGALVVTSIIAVYWAARIAMGFGRDVRRAIFAQVETFSQAEVNHFGAASLITRNTNDVQQVQTVVFMGLTMMVSAPILIVGGIIMALRTDVPLSGLLLVILPLMALVIGLVMSRAIPLFRQVQARLDRINQVMRDGYDWVLDDDAINLSAGEKQLLTIARAFLADPPILILDEATSSVDTRTEVLIQRARHRLMRGRTTFVIAHRLSTIRDADTILVMDHGRIVEQVDRDALLAAGGFYHDLYESQFTGALAEAS